MTVKIDSYKKKIEILRSDIRKAAVKSERSPDDVRIIAASKYADASQIEEVFKAGINDFGENRVDELLKKHEIIGDKVKWHFIGHLQRKKVKHVVPVVEYIHSIDKLSTLEKVNQVALENNKIQKLLIELNISGEQSKYGMPPDELNSFMDYFKKYRNVEASGLMTMTPLTDDLGMIRGIFKKLKNILIIINKSENTINLKELSMGMSNDFKIAVEEGSTMVRIGSLIFL
jgi:pyridoxal phosphate enzyme (YggS family)